MIQRRLGWFAGFAVMASLLLGNVVTGLAQQPEATDDEAARRHFRLGQAYYQNGQFAEAATEFEQAYQLSGRAALLYNVYLAHRDALHTRQSYEALRQYLDEMPDPPDEDHLRARLQHLEDALAANPETANPEVTPEPTPEVTPEPVATTCSPSSRPDFTSTDTSSLRPVSIRRGVTCWVAGS